MKEVIIRFFIFISFCFNFVLIDYLLCVATVIKDASQIDNTKKEEHSEIKRVNASGPLKPHHKKKNIPGNQNANDNNIFYAMPITSYFGMSLDKVFIKNIFLRLNEKRQNLQKN